MTVLTNPFVYAAPSGGSAHRYWRFNFTSTESGDFCALVEFVFGNPAGLIPTTSGTALSGGDHDPSLTAPNAFDGNTGTIWASNTTNTGWIGYDFGTPVDVEYIRLTGRAGYAGQSPKTGDVQYSDDGAAWTTYFSIDPQPAWTDLETRRFNSPSLASTVYRIYQAGGGLMAFDEVFMRSAHSATPEDTICSNDPSVGYAYDLGRYSSYSPDKAFDGLYGGDNCWVGQGECFCAYYFNNPVTVIEYGIRPRPSFTGQAPAAFTFDRSDDGGKTWTTLDNRMGQTWVSGVTNSYVVGA